MSINEPDDYTDLSYREMGFGARLRHVRKCGLARAERTAVLLALVFVGFALYWTVRPLWGWGLYFVVGEFLAYKAFMSAVPVGAHKPDSLDNKAASD